MTRYLIKLLITTLLIVLVSEMSKRSTLLASVLASIPLVSVFALVWLYLDTGDIKQVSALSHGIFWLVLPSLALFLLLPLFLRFGWSFSLSLAGASVATVGCYFGMLYLLGKFGIEI